MKGRRALLRRSAAIALGAPLMLGWRPSGAVVPPAYRPMVIQPEGRPERWLFDLDPAFERARTERKRLYVYLGADNCGYCRRYEAFLARHADALAPVFERERWLFVELRSNLSATAGVLQLKAQGRIQGYRDFQQGLGDERARLLIYPLIWLFDVDGRVLMPMPSGTGTFETVDEQIEILRLQG